MRSIWQKNSAHHAHKLLNVKNKVKIENKLINLLIFIVLTKKPLVEESIISPFFNKIYQKSLPERK
ncbi:MAG: hypothetical protein COY53_02105 [Elusimicrobia bacterium CG_4_10_14_0_8_um_filter_37_32]|nr:MAG: hypothetical protein COY53_02105 [Elusimicrobia bacterium CG_4_10_14_0_8_um_filter_37_32]